MQDISDHITHREAVRSGTATRHGLDNTPNADQLKAMRLVADKCFEPAREHFKVKMFVSSFFRALLVNTKAKGSPTSTHPKGESIDIDCDVYGKVTNRQLFTWLLANVEFDQLIWEYGTDDNPAWVHVSYSASGNRNEALRVKYVGEEKVWERLN